MPTEAMPGALADSTSNHPADKMHVRIQRAAGMNAIDLFALHRVLESAAPSSTDNTTETIHVHRGSVTVMTKSLHAQVRYADESPVSRSIHSLAKQKVAAATLFQRSCTVLDSALQVTADPMSVHQ